MKMMAMSPHALAGDALNWAVAMAVGYPAHNLRLKEAGLACVELTRRIPDAPPNASHTIAYTPATQWAEAGPLFAQRGVWFERSNFPDHGKVFAYVGDAGVQHREKNTYSFGPDHLTAGLRCVVALAFGDKVEVPAVLVATANTDTSPSQRKVARP